MLIKLSWIPYVLILFGVIGIASGREDDVFWGAICLIIGGIWLIIKHLNNSSGRSNTSSGADSSNNIGNQPSVNNSNVQRPTVDNRTPSAADASRVEKKAQFCPHCGAKSNEGDIYCIECGERI